MSEKGQSLVETVLILPFLLILVVGIAEGGFALNRQLTVVNAAREGARFGTFGAHPDAIYDQTLLATSQMFDFSEENAVIVVTQAKTDESGDRFEEWVESVYPVGATDDIPYVRPSKVLKQLGVEGETANLELVIVAVRYDHESVLGLPFVGALADRIPIGSWTVMRVPRRTFQREPGCCALPIGLPWDSVKGSSIGRELTGIRQFEWLFWEPDMNVPILESNLLNACNAKRFQDACDGSEGLKPGSWVRIAGGEMVGIQDETKTLIGYYYPVPVWDKAGTCADAKVVRIVGFALVEITEVNLEGSPKTINAKFRGWYEGCEDG